MTTIAPEPVLLSQDQADRILKYAIENRMYETGAEGLEAVDPATRLQDAATLAFQAKRAYANGNGSDNVREVLFIAEVDMTPAADGAAPAPPPAPPAQQPAPAAPPADEYASNSSEQLEEALNVFRASADNPAVQAEIAKIEAVLQQRKASAQTPPAPQPAQEAPPPAAPAAPAQAPAASAPVPPGQPAAPAPQAPAAPPTGGPEPHVPAPHPDLPPVPGRQNSGVVSPGGLPDGAENSTAPPPQPPAPDAAAVPGAQAAQPSPEGQLPPAQAPAQGGSREDLLRALTWEMMSAYGLTVESVQQFSDDQLRAVIANPAGPNAVPPAQTAAAPPVSPEREQLEAQVTGPMLKAWGRGRKQVPDLNDEDLRTMVTHPGGPSTIPQSDSPQQPAEAAVPPPAAPAAVPTSPEPAPPAAPPSAPAPTARPPSDAGQVNEAMEIIQREHLPIPADIEDPYKLPNDVSTVSDNELRSLHARAHAVEARVNWLISERDDEVDDFERLLADRRRVVKLATPASEDGKRLTKDQVEARVEADAEIGQLKDQIAKVKKGTGKLKVIRDNAHRDCERLSRQWSMRWREEEKSPQR